MTYIVQRSSADGDIVELEKSNWFEKTVELEAVTPLFQNIKAPTSKESDKRIFS